MTQTFYFISGSFKLSGVPQVGKKVTVTNTTKGESHSLQTRAYGEYLVDLKDTNKFPSGCSDGDAVRVQIDSFIAFTTVNFTLHPAGEEILFTEASFLLPWQVFGSVKENGQPKKGINVTVKNVTRNQEKTVPTNPFGEYMVDISTLPGYYLDGDSIEVTTWDFSQTSSVDLTNYPDRREVSFKFGTPDRNLSLEIAQAFNRLDRDLCLNIWKYARSDRDLKLFLQFIVASDRDLSLKIALEALLDRDAILNVQHANQFDRNLKMETEIPAYVDRSAKLDVDYGATFDRGLSLDVDLQTYVGYLFRTLQLQVRRTDFEFRNLMANVELPAYSDRDLSLQIRQIGYVDRSLKASIELLTRSDRSLIANVLRTVDFDRFLNLSVNYEGIIDRNMSMLVNAQGVLDRQLALNVEIWAAFIDRTLNLNVAKEFTFSHRDLLLYINYGAFSDRNLSINLATLDFRSLIIEVERIARADRDVAVNIEKISRSDRDLSLEVEHSVGVDRDLKLEVESTSHFDRNLFLEVIPHGGWIGLFDRGFSLNVALIRTQFYYPARIKLRRQIT